MSTVGKPGYKETDIGWIPYDWSVEQVSKLADVDSESLSKKTPEDFSFRYISLGDVDAGKLKSSHGHITYSEAPSRARRVVKQGDILFATVRPNLKGHYFARRIDGNVIASTGFAVVRAKSGLASPTYLYQSLLSGTVDAQIEKLTVGSNYPAVSSADVKGLLLSAPPLREQQRIAAILTAVDDKLDIIARQIDANQTLKRGLMQTLFSRGVGNQDADGRWVPHTEFTETLSRRIPSAWNLHRLDELTEKITDGAHKTPTYTASGVPFLRVTDIKEGEIDFSNVKYISREEHDELTKRCKPEKGDVLLSKNGTIGVARYVDWDSEFSLFVSLCLIKVGKLLAGKYLTHLISSDFIQNQIKNQSKQGTVTNLHLEEIRKFLIPLPPLEEQNRIVEILDTADARLAVQRATLVRYETLKRGLMQKLLTGEWRVKLDLEALAA